MPTVYVAFKLTLERTPANTVLRDIASYKTNIAEGCGGTTTAADVIIDVNVLSRRKLGASDGGSKLWCYVAADNDGDARRIQTQMTSIVAKVSGMTSTIDNLATLSEAPTITNNKITVAPTASPTLFPTIATSSPTDFPTRYPTHGRITTAAAKKLGHTEDVTCPAELIGNLEGLCDYYYLQSHVTIRGELLNGGGISFQNDYGGASGGRAYVDAFTAAVAETCSTTANHVGIVKIEAWQSGGESGTLVGPTGKRYDSLNVSFAVSVSNKEKMAACLDAIKAIGGFGADSSHVHSHLGASDGTYVHSADVNHYQAFINKFRSGATAAGVGLTASDIITVELNDFMCPAGASVPGKFQMLYPGKTEKEVAEATGHKVCVFEDLNAPQAKKQLSSHEEWTESWLIAAVICSLAGVMVVLSITYMISCRKSSQKKGTQVRQAEV
jgi:hypothetical protein